MGGQAGTTIKYASFIQRIEAPNSGATFHVGIINEFGSADPVIDGQWDAMAQEWCVMQGCVGKAQMALERARFFAHWRAKVGVAMARCNSSLLTAGIRHVNSGAVGL